MARRFIRTVLGMVSLLPERAGDFAARLLSRGLGRELGGKVTDKFLELLLNGMDRAFALSSGYRRNIVDFSGTYLFETADHRVQASAVFRPGRMEVRQGATGDCNIRVTFQDAEALWSFIFSKNQDILDSILASTVEVEGNLNYLYKFGFLARDLGRRLKVKGLT